MGAVYRSANGTLRRWKGVLRSSRDIDRRNFRRKVQDAGFVTPVSGRREGRHRPAHLFRFLPKVFDRYVQDQGELPF